GRSGKNKGRQPRPSLKVSEPIHGLPRTSPADYFGGNPSRQHLFKLEVPQLGFYSIKILVNLTPDHARL
ncbi:MAG TPA: hypothetical protein VIJ93_12990, partial [bacterium]